MPAKLYKMQYSSAACAAMMICDVVDAPVEMIELNLLEDEHMKPEFLKKNPLHTVPTLEDDDLIIHDSHVILTYLTQKHGKDDSLYPKDPKKRAQVDQKLYFEVLLFNRLTSITYPAMFDGIRSPSEKSMKALRETYDFLEAFLNISKFVAADVMTVADISIVSTVSAISNVIPIDGKKYPKVQAWFSYMEKQPFYQKYVGSGSEESKKFIKEILDL